MAAAATITALLAPFVIKNAGDTAKKDKARDAETAAALAPPALPPAPDTQSDAADAAAKARRAQELARKRSAQGGRASTLLTSGVLGAAPVQRKTLLGS